STTLPTKPLVTTTSATPRGMSMPSMLPMKLSSVVSTSAACAPTTDGGPLPGSVPFESSATRGRRLCDTSFPYADPLSPNPPRAAEMFGVTGGRPADTENQRERIVLLAAAQLGRIHRGERGAAHAFEQRPPPRTREHTGAGVAGRHQRVAFTARDEIRRDHDR